MYKQLLFIIAMLVATTAVAQPEKRRTAQTGTKSTTAKPANAQTANKDAATAGKPTVTKSAAAKTTTQQAGTSGQLQVQRAFPTAPQAGNDVVWRREVYRTLDLMEDANAPLYYPVEPTGKQMNLFTYVFRLMLAGRINAYQYSLDGNEHFDAKNKVDIKDLLDRYHIYYEEKNGKPDVAAQDIPGAEVTRYYIKESATFDQRTSTFQRRVTAICPVLMRGADEFDSQATPYPLFWLNMDEVADYLQKLPMMASNYNNVTTMTAGDFFAMNRYDGKIYKTNNMQGRTLSQYCRDDSSMTAEQQRIERELEAFEKGIWSTQRPDTAKVDTTAEAPVAKKVKKSDSTRRRDAPEARSTKKKKVEAEAAEAEAKKNGTPAPPRATTRRQRR